MKLILAVSGGVDSMALLAMYKQADIVVAHIDHGTRKSSAEDADFVRRKCQELGVKFYETKLELGEGVSEELARKKRYEFLKTIQEKEGGTLCTAHHLDDVLESIAINLIRGTGWRGLTPFYDDELVRPFIILKMRKRDVLKFAGEQNICFRQDPTNYEADYLRNRVREKMTELDETTRADIIELFEKQNELRRKIEKLVTELAKQTVVGKNFHKKHLFLTADEKVAIEVLREICLMHSYSLTRKQLVDFLLAIRTYAPHKKFNLPKNHFVTIL
ncbi:tRNA lysidine(34) synthetase TilS, partial [Candidatus Saccharibacteria bacterium]|nr:tRNA lysidine(34) synthetase TilS [Candidatus Saccharibacteria bacterium]